MKKENTSSILENEPKAITRIPHTNMDTPEGKEKVVYLHCSEPACPECNKVAYNAGYNNALTQIEEGYEKELKRRYRAEEFHFNNGLQPSRDVLQSIINSLRK